MKKYSGWLLPLILLSVIGPKALQAEILKPYIVDEKPQVLFGDSVQFLGHYGLENYVHEYVNGYLHISFTYTHSECCFANYPPILSISGQDPRTTTSADLKYEEVIYQLLDIGHANDYSGIYTYDIQFDATGYAFTLNRKNLLTDTQIINEHRNVPNFLSTDFVALANRYPYNPDPGANQSFSMSFTPVQVTDPNTKKLTPVIIIPGIMSSFLNDSGTSQEKWPNIGLMILPGPDNYLNELKLDNSGHSQSNIISTDIIKELESNNFFQGLIQNLLTNNFQLQDINDNPYDWRLDVKESAQALNQKINQIKSQTGLSKVDIIAHSMGGLVFKEYLNDYGGGSVNKFIDIGTPHTGSPKAFKILTYGDDLGFHPLSVSILSDFKVKEISQNMPSVYELLPSSSYGSYLYDQDDADSNGVKGLLNYSQTKDFMKNTGRNSLLVDRADQFHQSVDNLNPADYGIKTYNIVGCGTPTLDKIFVLNKEISGGTEYDISYTNGDGTVPLKSAQAMPAYKTYYLKNATHALMPSTSGVKELVASILATDTPDISPYTNLSTTSTGCDIPNGQVVAFHSPIDLRIYDANGNHVGPNANGDIENNIPGVDYEVIDGNKFAFLPDGITYTIKGTGTASGTFTTTIEKVTNGQVVGTQRFSDMPISTSTQVVVNTNTITLDNNNDGVTDGVFYSDDADVGTIINDLRNKIQNLNITDKFKKDLLKRVDNIEKKINSKKKNDKSLKGIQRKINNTINDINKKVKKGKLDDTNAQDIINLLQAIENAL